MNRREFLQAAGLCSMSYLMPAVEGWALSNDSLEPGGSKLIVVFLRGAVDGLNVVVPYGESTYYSSRPTIAVPRPGQAGGALDLDGQFALHPSLQPLMRYFSDGSLAFVHAAGSSDPTRSHFDAQDYMESGTPGTKLTSSGWMNRLLLQLPNNGSPLRAVNIGETLPRILQGPAAVASYAPASRRGIARKPMDFPLISQLFQSMYSGRQDNLGKAFNEGLAAAKVLKQDLEGEMLAANQGAPDAGNFKSFGSQLGALLDRDAKVQIAFLAIGGWDTHVNQGSWQGQLANKLSSLGNGLAQLASALGSQYKNTLIVVISEFGRTVKENGNGGTDHGHGNMIMLLGGPVAGGKVYGNWKGLAPSCLYEGRDLAVTTDFRSVLALAIGEHMHVTRQQMQEVFPHYPAPAGNIKGLLKA